MILNEQRQVFFANKRLHDFAGTRVTGQLLGQRPGEFLDCRQAGAAPSGWDTGEACRTRGAVNAIRAALAGHHDTRECPISNTTMAACDLRMWGSPFQWRDSRYTLVIAVDISDEKRRQLLERIFFNDILNTAGSVYGLSVLLQHDPASIGELNDDLRETAEALVNEIRIQRMLLAAERNELRVTLAPTGSKQLLESAVQAHRHSSLAARKTITIALGSATFLMETDATLLHRVLSNLLKHALEASRPGDTIELGAAEHDDRFVFWCHTPLPIPPAIQLQLFQRGFSTKGPSRGTGTDRIRRLNERYLVGKVALFSTPESGTRFELSFLRVTAPPRPGPNP